MKNIFYTWIVGLIVLVVLLSLPVNADYTSPLFVDVQNWNIGTNAPPLSHIIFDVSGNVAPGKAKAVDIRANLRPNTGAISYNLQVGGGTIFTETSGSHPIIANARFDTPSIISNGATVGELANVYIEGAPSIPGRNNPSYSFYIKSGPARLRGLAQFDSDVYMPGLPISPSGSSFLCIDPTFRVTISAVPCR